MTPNRRATADNNSVHQKEINLNITATPGLSRSFRRQTACLLLLITSPLLAADTGVTYLVTSDSHYDAFENEDRNERDRATIDQMNGIASVSWPDELGGGLIGQPQGVLLLGDVIDDGDRMMEGRNQSEQQNRYFLADQVIRRPNRTERREWDGTWGWRFQHSRELKNGCRQDRYSTTKERQS